MHDTRRLVSGHVGYIDYIEDTAPDDASTTELKHFVGYIDHSPKPALDNRRSA